MANTIKIKRGTKANLPTLNQGELAFCTDTDEVYIGTGSSNVKVLTVNDVPHRVDIYVAYLNGQTTSWDYWDVGDAMAVEIDSSKFPPGANAYLEVVIKTSDDSDRTFAELYNYTDGADVSGSEVTTTATDWVLVKSSAFSLASGNKKYQVRYHNEGATAYLKQGRIIITW